MATMTDKVTVGRELPQIEKSFSQRRIDADDRLTVHGVVKETHPEGETTRVVVDMWCENQDGEKTAVGTASGLLPE